MRPYHIFYVVYGDVALEEAYVKQAEKSLEVFSEKVIPIRGSRTDFRAAFSEIYAALCCEQAERVIILTSDLFGPFVPLKQVFDRMEERQADVWSLFLPMSDKKGGYQEGINPDFFVIEDWNKLKPDVERMTAELGNKEISTEQFAFCFSELLREREIVIGSYCDMPKERLKSHFPIQEDIYLPYDMLSRYGYPFLNKRCFEQENILQYSLNHELRRAMEYIRAQNDGSEDVIWEYILKTYNLYDIKKLLHLEYVVPSKYFVGSKKTVDNCSVAVFCHLFYEDLLEESICYLRHIPKGIPIYISTSHQNVAFYEKKLAEWGTSECKVLEAGARGRDAGALLVAFKEYVQQYDYICFLHDKKTSGGIAPVAEGRAFKDLVWDNLLAGEAYFFNILELFESNKRLGMLTPPLPIMGNYMKGVVGNEWTVCYEETLKLAERLKLNLLLDKTKPVFALSTTFWCRTEALSPLWEYPWNYESFPEEPLALDGTLNHAIERILIYIAQSQGYYSAVVSNEEYASVYLNNLMYMVDNLFMELHDCNLVEIKFPVKFSEVLTSMKSLYQFCLRHSRIIVYGAGAQAIYMEQHLKTLEVDFECFVVSKKKEGVEMLNGHRIREFAEIQSSLDKSCGIILAMSVKFQEEVIPMLAECGVDYYCIDAE